VKGESTKHGTTGDEDVIPVQALEHTLGEGLPVGKELLLGVHDGAAKRHCLTILLQQLGHLFLLFVVIEGTKGKLGPTP
jgi:hypothetical protein